MSYGLTDLKLLTAIADLGTLKQAAAQINISTSSASKRLANLESALGAVLFVRHRRGLTPTTAGQVALRHARQVLTKLAQLETELFLKTEIRVSR